MNDARATSGQFRYFYGGVDLISDVALDHLPVGAATDAERCMRVDATGESETWDDASATADALYVWTGHLGLSLYARQGGWLFRSKGGIVFAVDSSGTAITGMSGGRQWDDDAAEMLVHRVLPRAVQLDGCQVLHGAVVARDGTTVVLCGISGSGKSTLAAYLSRCRGWSVMSDDACVLRIEHGAVVVYATSASVSLFADSADEVGLPRSGRERAVARGIKQVCSTPTPGAHRARVDSILMLAPSTTDRLVESVAMQPLTLAESVVWLRPHSVRFNPDDATARRRLFYFLGELAHCLPVRVLTYPRRYDSLTEVADLIEGDRVTGRYASQ